MILTEKFMKRFYTAMNILIVLNAVAFGLITTSSLAPAHKALQIFVDISLIVFIIELAVRIYYYKKSFFTGPDRGWNYFDAVIIVASSVTIFPWAVSIRIFRVLRIFRQLNILRIIPSARRLRVIIDAILVSLPGVMWTSVLFCIIIYTYALLGCEFFGKEFPDLFGTAWTSLYTLFQLMVFDDLGNISRPVMELYPAAWVYFLSYLVVAAFVILNIVVALVLNALDEVTAQNKAHEERQRMLKRLGDEQGGLNVVRTLDDIEASLKYLREHLARPDGTDKEAKP